MTYSKNSPLLCSEMRSCLIFLAVALCNSLYDNIMKNKMFKNVRNVVVLVDYNEIGDSACPQHRFKIINDAIPNFWFFFHNDAIETSYKQFER